MNDEEMNEKEKESLISKEEQKTLTGVYLDLLSHQFFHNRICISGWHTRMCTSNNFSDKSSDEIFFLDFVVV